MHPCTLPACRDYAGRTRQQIMTWMDQQKPAVETVREIGTMTWSLFQGSEKVRPIETMQVLRHAAMATDPHGLEVWSEPL
jgi:hypothetical protein